MSEIKRWRICRVDTMGLINNNNWLLSSRKLTDDEADNLFEAGHYVFSFFDKGLDYAVSGNLIGTMVSFDGSKERAEELTLSLSKGANPFTLTFGEE